MLLDVWTALKADWLVVFCCNPQVCDNLKEGLRVNDHNVVFLVQPKCECKLLANWCLCVQRGESAVKTHHLEYAEGGILDMDDLLNDLVEDRDKVRISSTL